jgi:iron uptake system component EfeO
MGHVLSEILPKLASPRAALALVAAAVVVAAVTGSAVKPEMAKTGGGPGSAGAPAGALLVDAYGCGNNWTSAKPGKQTLVLYNEGTQTAEVYLVSPSDGKVFGEVVGLGPGTADGMEVNLGAGDYALHCIPADADPVTGPAVRVSGPASSDTANIATPGVAPVTRVELTGPTKQYQAYATAGLKTLLPLVQKLNTDIAAGDLVAARADWLPAHQQYERLGGAYGAFGDVGGQIDELPGGLPGGVTDPGFAGFHRIEYGLWHGQTSDALAKPSTDLVAAVTSLLASFPGAQIDPLAVGLRTHEILEDSARFELSGQSDEGSGTSLATVSANLEGTQALLGILNPILTPRYPQLPQATAALTRLRTLIDAQHAPDGSWTPLGRLTTAQREAINSAAGAAVELLAPVATICEPRMSS